jgi:hypothetical protein
VSFFDKTYTVTRSSPGYRDPSQGNKWVSGTTTDIEVVMNIQPLTGKEVDALPEGRREKKNIKGYSDTQIFAIDESGGVSPDIITYNGEKYEVYESKLYDNNIISHYKFLAWLI